MLHFAYGSNMSRSLMDARCPDAAPMGVAELCGFAFIITNDGYASIAPRPGHLVRGVLWRVMPRDLAALTIYESISSGLYRRRILPVSIGRCKQPALIYVARVNGEGRPRPGYLDLILGAARSWQFPESYIRELERWAPSGWRAGRAAEAGEIA